MAIRGSLREASLADVLQLLALGRKTGCLSVADRARFGRIYFDGGAITQASIVNRNDRLGDLLVKNGLITAAELDAAIGEQKGQEAPRLGQILVGRGAISTEQLERYIRVQIEEAVYYLFTWTQGTFSFEPDGIPDPEEAVVRINPESLLLEGARRVDEWALIQKRVPSPELVFRVDRSHGDPAEAGLTDDQRRVLPLLDGERSVREVIDESGLLDFEATKALFGLVQAGFARPTGRRRPAAVPPGSRTRLQEHRNLGVAFFRTGMLEEAQREFRRVLELEPGAPDASFYLGLSALLSADYRAAIRELMRLIEQGTRWAAAFHNLALALEAADRMEAALLTVEEGLQEHGDHPPLLLSRAVLLVKLHRFTEALEAFDAYEQARSPEESPPAVYYAFALIALAGLGDLAAAKRLGREGVQMHGGVAALLAHLGAVYERGGAVEEAETLYRRAVVEDPELPQAHKSLGDALYRRGAYAEAREAYARAGALGLDGGADLSFKLGNIAYERGEREEAVRLWEITLEANPEHAVARTNLELVRSNLVGRA